MRYGNPGGIARFVMGNEGGLPQTQPQPVWRSISWQEPGRIYSMTRRRQTLSQEAWKNSSELRNSNIC